MAKRIRRSNMLGSGSVRVVGAGFAQLGFQDEGVAGDIPRAGFQARQHFNLIVRLLAQRDGLRLETAGHFDKHRRPVFDRLHSLGGNGHCRVRGLDHDVDRQDRKSVG
ncbi:hypothetical protein G6F31_021394 [Rhizopus arrhizus]|nr:hypothetical protein G6F31_021394 [Rhizopus arrhizus]